MITVPFLEFKRNGWPWKTWNGIAWIHYMQILFQQICTKLPHNLWLVESVHGELWRQRANIKLYLDIQLHGGSTFLTPCVIQTPSITCDLLFAFFHFWNTVHPHYLQIPYLPVCLLGKIALQQPKEESSVFLVICRQAQSCEKFKEPPSRACSWPGIQGHSAFLS